MFSSRPGSPGSTTAGPNHSQKRKREDLQEKVE